MRSTTAVLLLVAFVVSSGCGYVMSGTWEDDPKNWGRAFRSTKPPDVVVIHSKYWRSPHWSYEFQYFFEIAPNAELKKQLFTANKLRQLTGKEATEARAQIFGESPSWFAPKDLGDYEVWVFADEPGRHFKVLLDKATGHMFMHDYQV
jgi:hypothetical protein